MMSATRASAREIPRPAAVPIMVLAVKVGCWAVLVADGAAEEVPKRTAEERAEEAAEAAEEVKAAICEPIVVVLTL